MAARLGTKINASNAPKVITSIRMESAARLAHSVANSMLPKVSARHAIKAIAS